LLFYASIRRELAQNFTAMLIVLLSIVMTMMLIRTLALANKGSVNPQDIFLIMSYLTLSFMPIILTLSLFLSVTSSLVRWYQDSEMAVWFASGQSLLAFLRPIVRFAWPVLLAIAASGLFIWPWANGQIEHLRSEFAQRSDIERIAPGEFQRNKTGTRVFFTDSQSAKDQSGQVFIYGDKDGKNTITTAQGGRLVRAADGSAQLELQRGQSVSLNTQTGEQSISTFIRYSTRIQDAPALIELGQTRSSPSHLLLKTAEGQGELSWRIGIALAAINLLLLALGLIKNTQRSGKGSHLALALMSFAVYYNLINFGQNWVTKGQISLGWWLLLLHGGVFVLSYLWLLQRQGSLPFFSGTRPAQPALNA
jgi:lipopolysaccharide export system permease protein